MVPTTSLVHSSPCFFQLRLNTGHQHTDLQIQHVHAQRIFHLRNKAGRFENTQRAAWLIILPFHPIFPLVYGLGMDKRDRMKMYTLG